MRTPHLGTALLVIAFVAVFVASRLGRAAGPIGIALALVLVVVMLVLLRDWLIRTRRPADERADPPRDVTPVEPQLGAPAAALRGQAPRPVVVVEPAESPTDDLETRLLALDRLRARGVVTDDEYEQKRAKLISDF